MTAAANRSTWIDYQIATSSYNSINSDSTSIALDTLHQQIFSAQNEVADPPGGHRDGRRAELPVHNRRADRGAKKATTRWL